MKLPVKYILPLGVISILVVAALPSYYFYTKYQKSQELLTNPTKVAKEEVGSLVNEVGQLMELPGGEEPTVATVSDKEKLKDQPFFSKTANGDKVLIFTKAGKVILYRPSINKIIEVAPLTISPNTQQSATQSSAATATQSANPSMQRVKVVLLNGTATIGLTNTAEKTLTADTQIGSRIDIVSKDNAHTKTYTKTLVVDLSGKQTSLAGQIATALKGDVGTLPTDEPKPTADILVIVGK